MMKSFTSNQTLFGVLLIVVGIGDIFVVGSKHLTQRDVDDDDISDISVTEIDESDDDFVSWRWGNTQMGRIGGRLEVRMRVHDDEARDVFHVHV